MKKVHYEKPDVTISSFAEEDVLAASGLDVGVDGSTTGWW